MDVERRGLGWVLVAGMLFLPAEAFAQAQRPGGRTDAEGYRLITRLNTPQRLITPLRGRDALRRSVSQPAVEARLRTVLDAAGQSELKAEVLRILSSADTSELRDVSVPPGQTMEWMAMRLSGKPTVVRRVRWRGAAAFTAFELTVDDGRQAYTFVLPKEDELAGRPGDRRRVQ